MKRTDPISIRVREEIKAALQQLAKADKRSLSSYIENVLEAHIEAQKKGKRRLTA